MQRAAWLSRLSNLELHIVFKPHFIKSLTMSHFFRTVPVTKITAWILLPALLNLFLSCHYYRVNKIKDLNAELAKENVYAQQKKMKYIIIYSAGQKYHLYNLQVNQDDMTLRGNFGPVSDGHGLYTPGINSTKRYFPKAGQSVILSDVHILSDSVSLNTTDQTFLIPLSSITRIDIIERDNGKTTASYVFGGLGITAGAIVIIIIAILALKSSCPFVYVHDGQSYVFKGEIFGGAIFKPLTRDDFMPVATIPGTDSLFKIKISNELLERQYTDFAGIIAAEHIEGEKIYIDGRGMLHSVESLNPPYEAKLAGIKDYSKELSNVDSSYCLFNAAGNQHHVNDLVMKFHRPSSAASAKLILNAKNSLWLDFAFGEFTKLFGVYYDNWIEKQRTADAALLNQWSEKQNLPLSVYIKAGGEWKLAERIPTIGPLASRDLCIPLHLDGIQSDTIEIKLTCGFMFWEVDYAGIDFSADKEIKSYAAKPFSAIDETGKDATGSLCEADGKYLEQPVPGCETNITYRLPGLKQQKQYDIFFHSRGYYEHVRNYTGLPDKKLLESFKAEGAFVDFSKQLYDELSGNFGFAFNN